MGTQVCFLVRNPLFLDFILEMNLLLILRFCKKICTQAEAELFQAQFKLGLAKPDLLSKEIRSASTN